jgi:hypothetical protein
MLNITLSIAIFDSVLLECYGAYGRPKAAIAPIEKRGMMF